MGKWGFIPILVVSFVMSVGATKGATIAHWQFSGTVGEKIVSDTDIVGGYVLRKFYDATYGSNAAQDVFYGPANPFFDTGGTSADFQNDPGDITRNDPGVGLVMTDAGVNTPLDLSTVPAFTIEAFIFPRTLRQCVIVRKYGGSPGQYYLDLRDTGDVQFSINADGNAAAAGAGAVRANEWSHMAGVFDETDAVAPMKIYVNGELKGQGTYRTRPGDTPRGLGVGTIIRDNAFPPANSGQFFNGQIDEVRISTGTLPVDQFLMNTAEGTSRPGPAHGAADVPRDVVLSWRSGRSVLAHDVYFGTALEDVTAASRTDPRGVLVSQGQPATTYDPAGVLALGQTYYWRVDAEVQAQGGAGTTIATGKVWSFTVEPFGYALQNVVATASSQSGDAGPQKTVDGSGLSAADQHSINAKDMWLSDPAGPQPTWIQYEFEGVRKLHEMWVWNQNQVIEGTIGFGAKGVTVEYSTDGVQWLALGDFEFARGSGFEDFVHNTTVNFGGVAAKYVRLTVRSNWGGLISQYGLSEVRFFHIPAYAREPQPADGAVNVSVDAGLDWRGARDAVRHEVHFGSNRRVVVEGTAPAGAVTESRHELAGLDFATTYYWKVNEVNEAASPPIWPGDVWSFATQEYRAIDDFESYTDHEGNRIFDVWIDGYANGLSGSIVGNIVAPFAEQKIVHGGYQSMPLEYNNVSTPWYSETERTFDPPQDWTGHAANTLMLSLRGRPAAFLQQNDGAILMSGAGADIGQMADEFRFASQRLTGNGSIVARVESLANTHAWAKAGVMIRETLDLGARFAAVYLTPGNGCRLQIRGTANGGSTFDETAATDAQKAITAPYWVKLERTGDTVKGSYSADGKTWTALAWSPQTVLMQSNVYIGLAVTSHSAGQPAAAKFSGVTSSGTGPWQVTAVGGEHPSNDPAPSYVAVEDTAGHIQRVTHPDETVVTSDTWLPWQIPLSTFSAAGVNLAKVKKVYLGVGDRDNPKPGGAGVLYLDDLQFGRRRAAGATIAHWQFNGVAGQEIVTETDVANGVIAYKFRDATYGTNAAKDVLYGAGNPLFDGTGTSADLQNDPASGDPGVGLVVPDTGVDTPLDLSTLGAFTIEAFLQPYVLRQAVIVRKYGGGQYYIDLRSNGDVQFSINADASTAAAGAGAITVNEWYHVAAVFDEADATAPMKIYIDGVLKGTAAFNARLKDSTRGLGIGCIIRDNQNPPGNSGQFFQGRIDEVRFTAAALAPEDFLSNAAQ